MSKRRERRLIKRAQALNFHNPSTVSIWGPWGILDPLRRGMIFPVPLTGMRLWMRRGEWQLHCIHSFDLVD